MRPEVFESDETPPPDEGERFALEARMDRVAEEKRRALGEPGPTWREWWFQSGSKWYVGLGFLILDVWLLSAAFEAGAATLGFLALLPALYAEFLLYRFLYYQPPVGPSASEGRFRRTWTRPVEYGRWTREAAIEKAGGTVPRAEGGPDPREFL